MKKTRPLQPRSTTELKRFFLFLSLSLSFYFLNFVIVVHGSVVTQRWSISFKAVDLRRHLSLNFWNIRNALALLSREEDSPSDWTDSLVSFYRFHGVLNKNLALKHLFASMRIHTYIYIYIISFPGLSSIVLSDLNRRRIEMLDSHQARRVKHVTV